MSSVQIQGYEVKRQDDRRSPWAIYKDGVVVLTDNKYEMTYKTRKSAVEAVGGLVSKIAYEDRIRHDDRSGVYVWTEPEEASINKLAEALKLNEVGTGFFDRRSMQERSRTEYIKDAYTILSWYAWEKPDWEGNIIVVELRRLRAARREAYRRAGIEFDPNFYLLICRSKRHPEHEHDDFREETVAACEKLREQIIGKCKPGEAYDFTIVPVPPAWPTDRIAA